jgi:predicted TIM-barrel fold metal-dependent hydrolase
LQQADLVPTMQTQPRSDQAVIRVTDAVPGLRCYHHVPAMLRQLDANGANIDANMRELAKPAPGFHQSLGADRRRSPAPVTDSAAYKPNLDYLFQTFGEDRVIFGSDCRTA